MMFFPLIIIGVLIFFYLNPSYNGNNLSYGRTTQSNDALEILNKRFANGEISEEDYLRRKSVLNQ
ncbi:SHOCT domain-containing protein [Clostridium thailandense]|nr:SHOCT domain-containing protein [Clostridium thailandense]